MATVNIPILEGSNPDTSGNVWQEPFGITSTNGFFNPRLWRFKNSGSVKIVLHVVFQVPQDYHSTTNPTVQLVWTAQATTGNVEWTVEYRDVATSASLDQATAQETVSGTAAAPAANNDAVATSITLTGTNLTAGDTVEMRLSRDKSSASDTMAADALLFLAMFSYANA
ncbi:MAG: hypothetical protein KGL39_05440 [Patescibacteria group bacterium]|nr:hypothetical protein [Patescibacteria group bacterium]